MLSQSLQCTEHSEKDLPKRFVHSYIISTLSYLESVDKVEQTLVSTSLNQVAKPNYGSPGGDTLFLHSFSIFSVTNYLSKPFQYEDLFIET